MFELLVQISQLRAAAEKMNVALNIYKDAIDHVKAAAAQLAGDWEGDGQVQFVRDQNQAYIWYSSLVEVVMNMIVTAKKFAENYTETQETLKSMM